MPTVATTAPPLVSLVLLNWNGLARLEKILPSFPLIDYPNVEVVVIDNGSTDGSLELAREWAAKCGFPWRFFPQEENLGYCRGKNLGTRLSRGRYLWLLDNDIELTPPVVRTLVEHMEANPAAWACMPMVHDGDARGELHNTGGALTLYGISHHANPNLRGRDRRSLPPHLPIGYTQGAVLFVRAKVWRRLRGFDPISRIFMDDYDFGARVHIAGGRIDLVTTCRVYHHEDAPDNYFTKPTWLWREETKGNLIFVLKNYQWPTVAVVLPGVLARQGFQALKHAFIGRDPGWIIRVWLWSIHFTLRPSTLHHIRKWRRFIGRLRRRADREFLPRLPDS